MPTGQGHQGTRPHATTPPRGGFARHRGIAYLAYHDPLTDLPNRARLEEQLENALGAAGRVGRGLALLYVDLNDFKLVNDSLGHAAGDELLGQVADRLREVIRHGDLLARQGGDEFLILLPAVAARPGQTLEESLRAAAAGCAARVAEQLERPFRIGEAEFMVDASVGVSLFPFDAQDARTLHMHADAAMYEAKAEGGGCAFYRASAADPLERLSLAARMRRALAEDQFELFYQPIVTLPDEGLMGVEALIRWNDPERGLVSPADFIPVAETTGLIDGLGGWVLEALCRQARLWADEGLRPHFGINVSPRQLRRSHFAERFATTIARHGLDPRRFVVEITESAWTIEAARTLPVLETMREHGIVLALDDFGAGYSSLTRLRELPVGVIKVDRAFLDGIPADPQACAIVTAIVRLAEASGCDVVAEGVETEQQRDFLTGLGCRLAQGFHFGRPVPAGEMTELLRQRLVGARRELKLELVSGP